MKLPCENPSRALTPERLGRMAQVLRLLAHPHRLKIVEILGGQDDAPVGRIAENLNLPPAATSQHLNLMRRVGLLEAERNGREVRYRIGDRRCLSILDCIRGKGDPA